MSYTLKLNELQDYNAISFNEQMMLKGGSGIIDWIKALLSGSGVSVCVSGEKTKVHDYSSTTDSLQVTSYDSISKKWNIEVTIGGNKETTAIDSTQVDSLSNNVNLLDSIFLGR